MLLTMVLSSRAEWADGWAVCEVWAVLQKLITVLDMRDGHKGENRGRYL